MKGSFSSKPASAPSPKSPDLEQGLSKAIEPSQVPERRKRKQVSVSDSPIIRQGVPVLSMVTGAILIISSSVLHDQAWTTEKKDPTFDFDKTLQLRTYNILCLASIGIFVGVSQLAISAFNMIFPRYGLTNWCIAQLIISGILGVAAVLAYANGVWEDSLGFAYFFTSALDSTFSATIAVLLLMP